MPDAVVKNVFFFTALPGPVPVGWTETLYSFHATLDLAQQAARTLNNARRQLLGVGATSYAWRGNLVAQKRISQVYFFQAGETTSNVFTNSPADDFDPAHEDLMCRVESIVNPGPNLLYARRAYFLAGLPDSQTDQLKAQGIAAAFVNGPAFQTWRDLLFNTPYYIRKKTANGPPPVFDGRAITKFTPIMVRHRNRGRPFFLFRGRRLV